MPPKPKAPEEAVKEQLDQAAENGQGLAATVTQDVPNITVEVLPNNFVADKVEGETLELDGPSALALIQLGHVKPV